MQKYNVERKSQQIKNEIIQRINNLSINDTMQLKSIINDIDILKGILEKYKLRDLDALLDMLNTYGKDKILTDANDYILFYQRYHKSPYKYAYEYLGCDYDINAIKSFMTDAENIKLYNECKQYLKYNKTLNNYSLICNYSYQNFTINKNVSHSDFTQLYPHLYIKIMKGQSRTKAINLLNKSIELKKMINNCNKLDLKCDLINLRALIKLTLNSYWGYASNMHTTFKNYIMFAENVYIMKMIKCYDKALLVKTDGVYGIANKNTISKLNSIDIPSEYESERDLFIFNVSNYIYGTDCVGAMLCNSITKQPLSYLSFMFDNTTDLKRLNGKLSRVNYEHLDGTYKTMIKEMKTYLER